MLKSHGRSLSRKEIIMWSILNLDAGFTPYGEGTLILEAADVFKGGEVNIRISGDVSQQVMITLRANSSDEVMKLLMATSAVRALARKKRLTPEIHIFMPYLPYARQDYETKPGEAIAIKVFADLINSQNYASVTVFDSHSDVGPAALNNCINISNHQFIGTILADKQDYMVVSPDSGAFKKIQKLCDAIGYPSTPVLCNKVRVSGGEITSITVTESDFGGKDIYIVDDICDGGRTFIALAEELRKRNAGKIFLIVSHGIFSYGTAPLEENGIDGVFTTDSFRTMDTGYVTQIAMGQIVPVLA
jgi:ribose-phosphate pyrophosphokinase